MGVEQFTDTAATLTPLEIVAQLNLKRTRRHQLVATHRRQYNSKRIIVRCDLLRKWKWRGEPCPASGGQAAHVFAMPTELDSPGAAFET